MSTRTIARGHCLAPERVDAPVEGGRYRRLFEGLRALEADDAALHALGRPGGPMDLGADESPDASVAAGWPFFGQFIAHDITADRSPLGHRAEPEQIRNLRTPRANLEGVYGAGPVGSPYLYDEEDPAKLLLGPGGHDVPRNQQGIALVGDPRNDVHLFMNQMQVGFIGLHNRLVERLREDGMSEAEVSEEARWAATWHYQWVILREFLPVLIGPELTDQLLDFGATLYQPADDPYIPFEFADAAYRYGHSQIRHRYRVNEALGPVPVFPDLLGFCEVPVERQVDWSLLFDVPGGEPAQWAKRIDGRLPESLIALPQQISGVDASDAYASLANRDLQRGQAIGLPSGEAVAEVLGVEPLATDQVGLAEHGWTEETPLWIYVLREAEALHNGDQLGPVGGRIVGEVLIGIIDADPESFRSVDRSWAPTLPSHEPGSFGIADLLVPAPE
ncbi:MAG: peroxidase family protein [Solirubrobacterales bacterium]